MTYTISEIIINSLYSVASGLIAAAFFGVKRKNSKDYLITIALLPVIVQSVIMLVNGSIGTGIAIMGAFGLVRFRSAPGKALDICGVFLSMAAGLASAAGYGYIGIILTVAVCLLILLYSHIPTEKFTESEKELVITVPENLNFDGAFDDILDRYTKEYKLVSVKTTNMGSLFKLRYIIKSDEKLNTKELIDDLRCRNGNLEISCMTLMPPETSEYL